MGTTQPNTIHSCHYILPEIKWDVSATTHQPGPLPAPSSGDWTAAEVIGFTRNVTGSGPGPLLLLTDFHFIICAVFWIWEVWEVVGSREQYSGAVLWPAVLYCNYTLTPGKTDGELSVGPRPPCYNTTLHWGYLIRHFTHVILYFVRSDRISSLYIIHLY